MTCEYTSPGETPQREYDRAEIAKLKHDLRIARDLLEYFVKHTQVYTRKGSHGGKIHQQPLCDAAQSTQWQTAKQILLKCNRPVPISGTLMDG